MIVLKIMVIDNFVCLIYILIEFKMMLNIVWKGVKKKFRIVIIIDIFIYVKKNYCIFD